MDSKDTLSRSHRAVSSPMAVNTRPAAQVPKNYDTSAHVGLRLVGLGIKSQGSIWGVKASPICWQAASVATTQAHSHACIHGRALGGRVQG